MRVSASARLNKHTLGIDTIGGLVVLDPITTPPNPISMDDFFVLELFTSSKISVSPFEEIEINWSIKTVDENLNFDDFIFVLEVNSNGEAILDNLEGAGSHKYLVHSNVRFSIKVFHRTQGLKGYLAKSLTISVDSSNAIVKEIPQILIDPIVDNRVSQLLSEQPVLRKRDRDNLIESTWSTRSIVFDLPLDIVLNNFHNGDLDIEIETKFSVDFNGSDPILDVALSIKSLDADFSLFEDITSFGNSATIAAVVEELLPFILNNNLKNIERSIIELIGDLIFSQSDLDGHLLHSVRVIPDDSASRVEFYFFPTPERNGRFPDSQVLLPTFPMAVARPL